MRTADAIETTNTNTRYSSALLLGGAAVLILVFVVAYMFWPNDDHMTTNSATEKQDGSDGNTVDALLITAAAILLIGGMLYTGRNMENEREQREASSNGSSSGLSSFLSEEMSRVGSAVPLLGGYEGGGGDGASRRGSLASQRSRMMSRDSMPEIKAGITGGKHPDADAKPDWWQAMVGQDFTEGMSGKHRIAMFARDKDLVRTTRFPEAQIVLRRRFAEIGIEDPFTWGMSDESTGVEQTARRVASDTIEALAADWDKPVSEQNDNVPLIKTFLRSMVREANAGEDISRTVRSIQDFLESYKADKRDEARARRR